MTYYLNILLSHNSIIFIRSAFNFLYIYYIFISSVMFCIFYGILLYAFIDRWYVPALIIFNLVNGKANLCLFLKLRSVCRCKCLFVLVCKYINVFSSLSVRHCNLKNTLILVVCMRDPYSVHDTQWHSTALFFFSLNIHVGNRTS